MAALEAMAPVTSSGYLDLNLAAKEPGYDPPNAIHLLFSSDMFLVKYLTK